jgi:hypothetical protein
MNYNITVLSPEEYLERFPMQAEEVPRVIGKPKFVSAYKVIAALKKNCVRMKDTRSKVGKLHCIMDSTAHKENKTAIVASTDPGEIDFTGLEKEEQRAVYMTKYCRQKAHWEADENIKEACKTFILSRFEPVYFQVLADPITEFKNVTVKEIIKHITTKYPPEPEEVTGMFRMDVVFLNARYKMNGSE